MIILYQILQITYLSEPIEIEDCYYLNTSLNMVQTESKIYVVLQPTKKQACQILQPGINVSILLNIPNLTNSSQVTQIEIVDYAYDFNYDTTKMLTIDVNSTNTNFSNFYLARSAQVILNSITYKTILLIGLINRVSCDNSLLIKENFSSVWYTKSNVCYNTIIKKDYIQNFDKSNILNLTLILSDYRYNESVIGNLTMQKVEKSISNGTTNPNNTSPIPPTVFNNSTLTYNDADGNLSLCFPINGIIIYESIDISKSKGYFQIYYQANNTTSNNSIVLYFSDTTNNYSIQSMDKLYSQINMIFMTDRVIIQTFVSNATAANQYNGILNSNQNYSARKSVYMYCKENTSVYGVLYSKTNISTKNSTEVFIHDYFAPNYSAEMNIKRFQEYRTQNNSCSLQFNYDMFALSGSNVIIEYVQHKNDGHFSCFQTIKYDQDGQKTHLQFIKNNMQCAQFNETTDSYFIVFFNNITNNILDLQKIDNFGLNNLEVKINVKFKIDPTQTIIYIALKNITIVDAATLTSTTEINSEDIKQKYTVIAIIAIAQIIGIIVFIICKYLVMPCIKKSIEKRQLINQSKKMLNNDGL